MRRASDRGIYLEGSSGETRARFDRSLTTAPNCSVLRRASNFTSYAQCAKQVSSGILEVPDWVFSYFYSVPPYSYQGSSLS
jgi:hypothetical protein